MHLVHSLAVPGVLPMVQPTFLVLLEVFATDVSKREVIAIASALKENKGLVELHLVVRASISNNAFTMSDETWDAVCESLKEHPTLQLLNLWSLAPAVSKSRIQALVDMLKVNISIHTLHLNCYHNEYELFQRLVIPYLDTNWLRPHILAIQKTGPIAYRTKVLGRALLAARTDTNSFWMLLSRNFEGAFWSTTAMTTSDANLSKTATTTPAANLPTPGTTNAAIPANNVAPIVAAAAATAAAAVTASRATSTAGASTAAYATSPSDSQKRKARP
jgi:hypothetical protein